MRRRGFRLVAVDHCDERGPRIGFACVILKLPARLQFGGLDYFVYDPAWRLEGASKRFEFARTLRVQDVIGGTQEWVSPGAVCSLHAGASTDSTCGRGCVDEYS